MLNVAEYPGQKFNRLAWALFGGIQACTISIHWSTLQDPPSKYDGLVVVAAGFSTRAEFVAQPKVADFWVTPLQSQSFSIDILWNYMNLQVISSGEALQMNNFILYLLFCFTAIINVSFSSKQADSRSATCVCASAVLAFWFCNSWKTSALNSDKTSFIAVLILCLNSLFHILFEVFHLLRKVWQTFVQGTLVYASITFGRANSSPSHFLLLLFPLVYVSNWEQAPGENQFIHKFPKILKRLNLSLMIGKIFS